MKKRAGTLLLAGDSVHSAVHPLWGLEAYSPRKIVKFWPSEMDSKAI